MCRLENQGQGRDGAGAPPPKLFRKGEAALESGVGLGLVGEGGRGIFAKAVASGVREPAKGRLRCPSPSSTL